MKVNILFFKKVLITCKQNFKAAYKTAQQEMEQQTGDAAECTAKRKIHEGIRERSVESFTDETGKKKRKKRETAGKSRRGEIKPKAPPARAANGSANPT